MGETISMRATLGAGLLLVSPMLVSVAATPTEAAAVCADARKLRAAYGVDHVRLRVARVD
jgi:hypothetical protein